MLLNIKGYKVKDGTVTSSFTIFQHTLIAANDKVGPTRKFRVLCLCLNAFRVLVCQHQPCSTDLAVVFSSRCVKSHVFTLVLFSILEQHDLINSSVTRLARTSSRIWISVVDWQLNLRGIGWCHHTSGSRSFILVFNFCENHWGSIELNIERLGYPFNRINHWIPHIDPTYQSTSGVSYD